MAKLERFNKNKILIISITLTTLMKNRNGSYKKVLFSIEHLTAHREELYACIDEVMTLKLKDYDSLCLYILLFLRLRHPKNYLQPKSKLPKISEQTLLLDIIPACFKLTDWEREKLKDQTTYSLFLNFNLKGIPAAINRSMVNWANGKWKIKLLNYIPSSLSLLKLQVQNQRCVTIITNKDDLDTLVLDARDPLSFVLHDLDHADHFFNHESILKGQLGFYAKVCEIYDHEVVQTGFRINPEFEKDFNYVVSDMNAYVIHLLKCFKASFTNHQILGFPSLLEQWDMNESEVVAMNQLNSPHFNDQDEAILVRFFEKSAGEIS